MKRQREEDEVGGPTNTFSSSRTQATKLTHPFKANFNDHFETNLFALRDLYPFIDELRQLTRPSCPESFTLYDPYFCTGKVKESWKLPEFGVTKVIHENRDFYEDIKKGIAPPLIVRDEVEDFIKDIGDAPAAFDVCVTNPPFSENHIERFLTKFAIPSRKPWAMLVPDYIASKPWYVKLVETHFTQAPIIGRNVDMKSAKGGPVGLALAANIPRMPIPMMPLPVTDDVDAPEEIIAESVEGITTEDVDNSKKATVAEKYCQEPFYIVPKGRYDFDHPIHAGRDRSHFKSLWIVSGGRRTAELLKSVKSRSDPSKVTVASGRVDLIRTTSAPGTTGSAALIPNPPRNKNNYHKNKY